MSVRTYFDAVQSAHQVETTPEAVRDFGLQHAEVTPPAQIAAWFAHHREKLEEPLWGDRYERLAYKVGLTAGAVAFGSGVFSGIALLKYSGTAPVNIVYFLAFAVGIPLISMLFALIAIMRASRRHNALVQLSPASWIVKMLALIPGLKTQQLDAIPVHPRLANWIVIERGQMMAWWFAAGMLLALLGVVVTQDIAFAWSTTLSVTPEQFAHLIRQIAWPWRGWLDTAVPDVSLITHSHYFRLGTSLDPTMVRHAQQLGQWWKFLMMATLVYGVGLRFVLWMAVKFGLRRAVRRAMLGDEAVAGLLHGMNTPMIETKSQQPEARFHPNDRHYTHTIDALADRYTMVLGWSMEPSFVRAVLDGLGVTASQIEVPGGNGSLDEDDRVIASVKGSVLLLVKAWEPPMMDWVDFIEDLAVVATSVTIAPIGSAETQYQAHRDEAAVWSRKLQTLRMTEKVTLWQA